MKNDAEKEAKTEEKPIDIHKKTDVDAVKKAVEDVTDSLGYTNYGGEASLTRRKLSENDDSDVSLLKMKSDACATKSDALDDFEDEIDDLDLDEPPSDDHYMGEPYGISPDDFVHNSRHHSQDTLIFYSGDGVFTDECATFVDDASLLVGEKWRMEIGKYEENVAYIRNDKIAKDYEIIVEDCSFADVKKHESEEV